MVLMMREVLGINDQVVVSVQFPKLAVQHVKMLIREEGELLVDVRLRLQTTDNLQGQRGLARMGEEDHTYVLETCITYSLYSGKILQGLNFAFFTILAKLRKFICNIFCCIYSVDILFHIRT